MSKISSKNKQGNTIPYVTAKQMTQKALIIAMLIIQHSLYTYNDVL